MKFNTIIEGLCWLNNQQGGTIHQMCRDYNRDFLQMMVRGVQDVIGEENIVEIATHPEYGKPMRYLRIRWDGNRLYGFYDLRYHLRPEKMEREHDYEEQL